VTRATDRELELAHRLPDDFVEGGGGSAVQSLIELVGENWDRFAIGTRAELVEALLPILDPLLESGAEVTDRERGVCEAIVAKWMQRQ